VVCITPDVCPVDWFFICLFFYRGGVELGSSAFRGGGVVGYFSCVCSVSQKIDERWKGGLRSGKLNPHKLLEGISLVGCLGLFVDSVLNEPSKIQTGSKGLCPVRTTFP